MGVKITKRIVDAAGMTGSDYFIWDSELKGFGLRVSAAGRKTFIVQYRVGGRGSKSRRESLGAYGPVTPDQARGDAWAILAKVAKGIDPVGEQEAAQEAARAAQHLTDTAARAAADEAAKRNELQLSNLAKRFMAEHVAIKRKPNTQSFYKIVIDNHIAPRLGDKDAREITPGDVEAMHVAMAGKATMANRAVAILGAIYGWADRLSILPEGTRNPTRKIELFKERGRDRFLSVAELARLGEAIRTAETVGIEWAPRADAQVKHAPKAENRLVKIEAPAAAAIRLLLFTGARLREILHLEWSSVDVERGLLRLRDSKTGPKVVMLNAPARAILAGIAKTGRYVIRGSGVGEQEKPRADLKRPWALVCRAAGLSGLRIHDLRHSFASVGAGDGHGLAIVGKLLGHSQARTTERYAHLDNDPLRRASDSIAGRIATAMGEAPTQEKADVIPIADAQRKAVR